MNHGPEHPSAAIRFFTSEEFLASYRAIILSMLAVVAFFLVRFVGAFDESERKMDAFKVAIQVQMSDFKIDVARNTANSTATILAIQGRMDEQSRRMDGFGVDMREVNKKLYEGRRVP